MENEKEVLDDASEKVKRDYNYIRVTRMTLVLCLVFIGSFFIPILRNAAFILYLFTVPRIVVATLEGIKDKEPNQLLMKICVVLALAILAHFFFNSGILQL